MGACMTDDLAALQSKGSRWLPTTRKGWLLFAASTLAVLLLAGGAVWTLSRDTPPTDAAAAPTPLATPSASASDLPKEPTCTAELVVRNEWEGGFNADVVVRAHDGAVDGWTVVLDMADTVVAESWNSTLPAGATGVVEAGHLDYNQHIAHGGEVGFGFNGSGRPDARVVSCNGVAVTEGPVSTADGGEVAPPANSASGDDWLSVDGNQLVTADGRPVWLTGANWFGFNTSERVLHGLWSVNLEETVNGLASRGFNVLRVPVSTELLLEWRAGQAAVSADVNTQVNPELEGATSLEVFDAMLAAAQAHGVKVIVDVHSAKADNMGHLAPVWTAEGVTREDFMVAWEWVAERYAHDDTIVGFDLKNEPHGTPSESPRATWGDGSEYDWREVASEAAERIHAVHPHALLLVEGIEATPKTGKAWSSTNHGDYDFNWWGGNLRFAGDQPVDGPAHKIMYSPHDYGPLVHEQPWFQGSFSASSLERDVWGPNWLYLHDDEISPLLIGEWGGRVGQDERQDHWLTYLRDLIVDRKLHHTFWALNPNSGDTGGLLMDDWTSWDASKYDLVEPALWQDADGRFVGLDHKVPLPGGVTVAEFYAAGGAEPIG